MSPLPAVLTVEETAAVLRIGRSSAYDGVRRGDIPSIRVGRDPCTQARARSDARVA